MHRPPMDWDAAERRRVPGSVEREIWDGLQRLIAARRSTRATHAYGAGQPLWTGNDHVYGLLRSYAGERLLVLANFSAGEQSVRRALLDEHGLRLDGRGRRSRRPPAARRRRRRPRAVPVPLDQGLIRSASIASVKAKPGLSPPSMVNTRRPRATTPSPWRGVGMSGSARQRRVAGS